MAGIKRGKSTVKSGGISRGGGYKKASVSKSSKPKSTPCLLYTSPSPRD